MVGGGGPGTADFALVRLSADGKTVELNRDYNVGDAATPNQATDVAFQPDGTIVLVGTSKNPSLFGNDDITVIRVEPALGTRIGGDIFILGDGTTRASGWPSSRPGRTPGRSRSSGPTGTAPAAT